MMQAGVRLRQDTETTLPELPEQHRIREKEEELHGLESVHMAESETKCTAPGLNTLEPECVTANRRVSDLHHTEASLIKTETDLSPISSGDLKTETLDFTDLAYVAHQNPDQIKTETDGDHIKTEHVSFLPDIKSVYIKSDELKLESSEILVNDLMNTELNGAGVDEKEETELCHSAGEPNPNCKISGKNQSSSIHDVGIHIREKPHQCFQCGKCFFKKCHLNDHKRTHTGEKPYKCDQCEKSFHRISHLKSHLHIHTGKKPYTCDQCDKSFYQRNNLKSHLHIHTAKKPYTCDQCEKSFSQKNNLKSHLHIHTGKKPYTCDQCEKSFTQKNNLKCHQRVHTGERPYECEQCRRRFSSSSSLYQHKRIHTGEMLYKCEQCGKSYADEHALKFHQGIHTGESPTNVNIVSSV